MNDTQQLLLLFRSKPKHSLQLRLPKLTMLLKRSAAMCLTQAQILSSSSIRPPPHVMTDKDLRMYQTGTIKPLKPRPVLKESKRFLDRHLRAKKSPSAQRVHPPADCRFCIEVQRFLRYVHQMSTLLRCSLILSVILREPLRAPRSTETFS